MLLNITVLDDLYIYGTGLADRRADMDVLKEFDAVSAHMMNTEKSLEMEERVPLKTPCLQIGVILYNFDNFHLCLTVVVE